MAKAGAIPGSVVAALETPGAVLAYVALYDNRDLAVRGIIQRVQLSCAGKLGYSCVIGEASRRECVRLRFAVRAVERGLLGAGACSSVTWRAVGRTETVTGSGLMIERAEVAA